jgi:hypothetical protein
VEIRIQLDPYLFQHAYEFLSIFISTWDGSLTCFKVDEADPDFRNLWMSELCLQTQEIVRGFMKFLRNPHLGRTSFTIEDEIVMEHIRAISALRLFLRAEPLERIGDEVFENGTFGDIEFSQFELNALRVYNVIGALQEYLVQQLDPEVRSL